MSAAELTAAIVIPVHNRKRVTCACLEMLEPLIERGWPVYVVDDGSSDGTSEAVREGFPEVRLLAGDGSLFWTGAMELGMRRAIADGARLCVWLNDDVTVTAAAIEQVAALAEAEQALVSAQGVIDLEGRGEWFFPGSYRGRNGITTREIDPAASGPVEVDTCRGNLVAIPRAVIDRIGYPDGRNIPHIGGDTDYGLRATRAGFRCLVLPTARFYEEENIRDDNRSWLLGETSLGKNLRLGFSKRGSLYPRMMWTYFPRHWGWRGALVVLKRYARLVVIVLLRLLLPHALRVRWFGGRSHAYQAYQSRGV